MSNALNEKVYVIGGGAAGFFAAISCKQHHPEKEVIVLEKSNKVLSKVKISGGGRCNVTNEMSDLKLLSEQYPRGERKLRKLFGHFNTSHTIEWYESRGVALKTYPDGCIFPESNDSQTIIDCLVNEAKQLGVVVKLGIKITHLSKLENGYKISLKEGEFLEANKVIVATGGHPKLSGFEWMSELNLKIDNPVPSLFTFNMPGNSITDLMGVVVDPAIVKIQGTKLKADGPLLITHWGMSGPAILKLSAWGARILEEKNYQFNASVNWVNNVNEDEVYSKIVLTLSNNPKKVIKNVNPYGLSNRLWIALLAKKDIHTDKLCGEIGKKQLNSIVSVLCNDIYKVKGKTTFKEEFVTCGGVKWSNLNGKTLESSDYPGLYFAGEVMDIDGITGGFNFQGAWTTGFIAGKLL